MQILPRGDRAERDEGGINSISRYSYILTYSFVVHLTCKTLVDIVST
jgi:hypothetical protein